MTKTQMKKVIKRIETILTILMLAVSVTVVSIVFIARLKNETPRIFGYSFHLVVTDSMTPVIEEGDFVVAQKADASQIEVGDDIVFVSPDPLLKGISIIHRVVDIREDGGLVTQGTKLGAPVDSYPVYEVEGVFVTKSSALGSMIKFVSNPINAVFTVVVIVLVYISYKLIAKTITIAREKDGDRTTEK